MNKFVNGRVLEISITIIFCSLCLISVSTGQKDYPINISDSLTLHSGDIITLQADDNTYLTKRSAGWTCTPKNCRAYYLALTEETKPDEFSEFVVETVGKDQIRLLDKDTERYLYVEDYGTEPGHYIRRLTTETGGRKQLQRGFLAPH